MDRDKISAAAETLAECSGLEGTEVGEAWSMLAAAWNHRDCFGDAFVKALGMEILGQAKRIGDECEVVEEEQTIKRNIRRLKWKDE